MCILWTNIDYPDCTNAIVQRLRHFQTTFTIISISIYYYYNYYHYFYTKYGPFIYLYHEVHVCVPMCKQGPLPDCSRWYLYCFTKPRTQFFLRELIFQTYLLIVLKIVFTFDRISCFWVLLSNTCIVCMFLGVVVCTWWQYSGTYQYDQY